MDAQRQSLRELIDDRGISPYQMLVIALCTLVALLDGFDTQSVAFVAPLISREWGVPPSAFGNVFAAGLLGSFIGAIVFGMIADRLGRRFTVWVTVAIFASGSAATIFTHSPMEMTLCRLLTGFGLGGALPTIVALAAEYAPAKLRSTVVTAMFCGFPLGAVLGAVISGPLIEQHGWHIVFWMGAIAPLALLPVFLIASPESMDWLRKNKRADAVAAILKRCGRDNWDGDCTVKAEHAGSLASLFRHGRAARSILLAVAFFLSLLMVYLLLSWAPTIAVQAGLPVRIAVLTAAVLNLAGIVGGLIIARMNDRLDALRVVPVAYAIGALAALAFALTGMVGPMVFPFSLIVGVFCLGAQISLISVAAAAYPTEIRATGVGFLLACGRAGAIAGPLVGGLAIDGPRAPSVLAFVVAAASIGSGLALLGMKWSGRKSSGPSA